MTVRDDGGPAFPAPDAAKARFGGGSQDAFIGMTLRDYFAAKAIQGLCVEAGKANPEHVLAHARCAANAAYAIADAMLRERAK